MNYEVTVIDEAAHQIASLTHSLPRAVIYSLLITRGKTNNIEHGSQPLQEKKQGYPTFILIFQTSSSQFDDQHRHIYANSGI